LLYCTIAFTNTAYNTSLPLFYSSPLDKGGLGLNSQSTAFSLSVIASSKLFCQVFVFDKVFVYTKTAKRTFTFGMGLYIPNHILIPFLAIIHGISRNILTIIIMTSFGVCESFGYLSVILMITESQNIFNLGKAHGLASTMAALSRTIAPALMGVIWELGVDLGWNWLVFAVGGLIATVGFIAAGGDSFAAVDGHLP
jgi:hypothetical protein